MKRFLKNDLLKVFDYIYCKNKPLHVLLDLDLYSKSVSGSSNSVNSDPMQIGIRNPVRDFMF